MASHTKHTEFRRKRRHTQAGRDRKKKQQAQGTTPVFPLHTETSHENAPEEQLPASKRE